MPNMEMRQCFTETLKKIMKDNRSIVVCDADLAGSSGEAELFREFPDRSVDFGISESNMAAAAAGLSLSGLKPIIHSFAPFVTRRVMDQVYVSLGFSKCNCLIYGSDPGYFSKYNGPTHTTFEDIAIMTSIPGMQVVAPSDIFQWKYILEYYASNGGLYYVRVPRQEVNEVYSAQKIFGYQKGIEYQKGEKLAVITCGPEISDVIEVAKEVEKNNDLKIGIYDLFWLKPFDEEMIKKILLNYEKILVIENHNIIVGIGQQIAMKIVSTDFNRPYLKDLAVNDRYGEVGTLDYLKKILGIDKESIKSAIEKMIV